MGKKYNKRVQDDYEVDGEDRIYNGYYDDLAKHRTMKRMKNAMRSKNIDDLLELEDDDLI